MFTLKSIIGNKKEILYALIIVILACVIARAVFAKSPSPQQVAAADVPVQQKIMDENKAAFEAYNTAYSTLQKDMNCVSDASQCPLTSGEPSAK